MSYLTRLSGPLPTAPDAALTSARIIQMIPLDSITMQALIRDRDTGPDFELAELITSIREIGLSNPIQVHERSDGRYDLVQGFRRLSAYRTLHHEHGAAWAHIPAGFLPRGEDRTLLYRRMVDENIVRKDLSFAEMAKTAQVYAADPTTSTSDVDSAVTVLFQSAGYQRRSYIRQFAQLLDLIGPYVNFPQDIPRNLGLMLLKQISQDETLVRGLRGELQDFDNRSVMQELAILKSLAYGTGPDPVHRRRVQTKPGTRTTFQIGKIRCTAGQGSLTLKLDRDFTAIDRVKLTQGIARLLSDLT